MLVAGPNLTIDRTAALAQLRPGEVLQVRPRRGHAGRQGAQRRACGAGARALRAAGLVRPRPHRPGGGRADRRGGVELSGVPCGGELRSTMIVQERGGRTTVMNEPGPRVDERRWADYENAVRGRLTSRSVLVCSGSVPPGAPADAYGRLDGDRARGGRARRGRRGGLDAAASAGRRTRPRHAEPRPRPRGRSGCAAKARRSRAEPDARPRAMEAAEALLRQGARAAVVTADAAGAAVATGGPVEWIPAPRVAEVRNPIGAGDAFLRGWRPDVGARLDLLGRHARGRRGRRGERGAPDGGGARSGAGSGVGGSRQPGRVAGELNGGWVGKRRVSRPARRDALLR